MPPAIRRIRPKLLAAVAADSRCAIYRSTTKRAGDRAQLRCRILLTLRGGLRSRTHCSSRCSVNRRPSSRPQPAVLSILGRPEDLEKVLHELEVHGVRIDRIVIATKFDSLPQSARDALLRTERTLNIRFDLLDHTFGFSEALNPPKPASGPLISARLDFGQLASRPYLRWKRVLDSAAAIFCVVCLAPLMALVGLVVMLDVGYPPIFWQQRPGALGRPIKILKFRTMGAARDHQGRRLTDAERISVVGRFLRRVRLDELPQVYNVLFGQMSLVGPRPLLPADQSPGASARLRVRPGLTGWAQVNGGRHLSIHDKAALDLWYVKNASFSLDVAILLSTARTILFGERIDRLAIRRAWRELGCEPPGALGAQDTSHNLG
jgi:lipopolysaccharide/colanic/teichoic acid biosynthesis glycosyltransferase